jgi:molybdopterin-guanine dinucleotide biosynthesis protein A
MFDLPPNSLVFPTTSKAIALYGTSCDAVAMWVSKFQSMESSPSYFVDAIHGEVEEQATVLLSSVGAQFQLSSQRLPFSEFYWVNGNHFSAPLQIVINDSSKQNSLEKRKTQLTNVALVISENGIPEHLQQWGVVGTDTVCLNPSDDEGLKKWVISIAVESFLHALVLVGGESERMGLPKMELNYHGVPQWKYLESVCQELNIPVVFSCRKEQQDFLLSKGKEIVFYSFGSIGPLGAIASAMNSKPGVSWVVLACDMPGLNAKAIRILIQQRNKKAMATAFWNDERQWFEPLAAIWESQSKGEVFAWLAQSQCPRKLLSVMKTQGVKEADALWYQNVNTPEEKDSWLKRQV